MKHAFLPALLAASLALPAAALDLENMNEAERKMLQEEIRGYLLENPEVIMEAVSVLEQRQAEAAVQQDKDLVAANEEAIFNDGHSWVGGNPDGDITLVEFMDYRCGYCKKAFSEVDALLENDGNIRFIVKEFPVLGPESTRAAQFAIATKLIAGDDAYQSVHDAMMQFGGPLNDATFTKFAKEAGADADAILAHMQSPDVQQVIADNHQLARKLQINGTPTFVMNSEMLRGYLPAAEMARLAEEVRTE